MNPRRTVAVVKQGLRGAELSPRGGLSTPWNGGARLSWLWLEAGVISSPTLGGRGGSAGSSASELNHALIKGEK